METLVDLTFNLVLIAGAVYLGGGFVLEMIDRWNQLDPATVRARAQARAQAKAQARAIAGRTQPALPAATVASVELKTRELEPVVLDAKPID